LEAEKKLAQSRSLSKSAPRRAVSETGEKDHSLPLIKPKPLLTFTLGFILGFNVTNYAQESRDRQGVSGVPCLPSAQPGGVCLPYHEIQNLIDAHPDPSDLRDLPPAVNSPNGYVEEQI